MQPPGQTSEPEFDIAATLGCGQVFHWSCEAAPTPHGGPEGRVLWSGSIGSLLCRVEQAGGRARLIEGDEAAYRHYFALDHPLDDIYETFPSDAYSRAALQACRGLRIIRQPFWECLATFLFSSQKKVAHIRQISLELRRRFGEEIGRSGHYSFPAPEVLAALDERHLLGCMLGYRAKYLLETARRVRDGAVVEEELRRLPAREASAKLESLPGVGRKIAACVLLFSLGHLDAVPVDVWVARIVRAMRPRRKLGQREIERLAPKLFGPCAGYVQQYLFHYARVHGVLPR